MQAVPETPKFEPLMMPYLTDETEPADAHTAREKAIPHFDYQSSQSRAALSLISLGSSSGVQEPHDAGSLSHIRVLNSYDAIPHHLDKAR